MEKHVDKNPELCNMQMSVVVFPCDCFETVLYNFLRYFPVATASSSHSVYTVKQNRSGQFQKELHGKFLLHRQASNAFCSFHWTAALTSPPCLWLYAKLSLELFYRCNSMKTTSWLSFFNLLLSLDRPSHELSTREFVPRIRAVGPWETMKELCCGTLPRLECCGALGKL